MVDFRSGVFGEGRVPRVISVFGLFLLGLFLVEWLILDGFPPAVLQADFLVSALISVPFFSWIIYGGVRLEAGSLPPERYPRVWWWCLGGSVAFFGLNVVMAAVWTPETVRFIFGWLRYAATVGGAVGLTVGFVEARAIERAREAERAAVRTQQLKAQRDHLDYLNNLLRHEVLNAVQVVDGNADLLLSEGDLDDDQIKALETIRGQSRDMTTVIKDVRAYIQASREDHEFERIDLASVIRSELAGVARRHETCETTASIPETIPVMADDLLARAFANLFDNAVEHNDSERPRIEVTADVSDETVTVEVADNGSGIPEEKRETLFERRFDADHGIGLYLVDKLVDRYGGRIELAETGPEGTTFRLVLPLADDAPDGAVDQPSADPAARSNVGASRADGRGPSGR